MISADPGTILVTGGAGFIGCNLVHLLVREMDMKVVDVDKLTYAGNLANLADLEDDERHVFVRLDVADRAGVRETLERHRPRAVIHLAAETHVDRSIESPDAFVHSNLVGTFALLEEARRYAERLRDSGAFRFVAVSTDEVHGSLGDEGRFDENTPYDPSSPYAATKAGADHLVRAYHRTYGLPAIVTNCSNNYGPYQHPEKLIPLAVRRALAGRPIPVYGEGRNVRDWLYVEDHARALWRVLQSGHPGATYAIGGSCERRNIDVVRDVCALLDEIAPPGPRLGLPSHADLIAFVTDRPGHDYRYAVDASRIRRELGWSPREDFASGLRRTVRWYVDHREWMDRVAPDLEDTARDLQEPRAFER